MKNSNHLIKLALSLTAPALGAWLIGGRGFSPDLLSGAYTLAGLFYIAATDYMPRRVFAGTATTRKPSNRRIRVSLSHAAGSLRFHRAEKLRA